MLHFLSFNFFQSKRSLYALIYIFTLMSYTSLSFGQIVETRRKVANKLWTDYSQDTSNPSKLPAAIPHRVGNEVDQKEITPTFDALEATLTDMVNNNGGVITFNNSLPVTINFSRHIQIRPPFLNRDKIRTVVIQGENITFDGGNNSSIFVLRGKIRLIIQNAIFKNANLKEASMNALNAKFRIGGGAIEVAQGGTLSASLRVRNCQFINNTVSHFRGIGENQNGGAIRFNQGTIGQVFGCIFRNNRAVTGGAIGGTSINKLTIIDSKFENNLSNSYESTVGFMNVVEGAGAIRVDRTLLPVEIYGSTFTGNSANVKASVIEVFIRPIPEGSQNYPKNGFGLIIDDCIFRKNKYNDYAGVSNFKRVFFGGCIVFHSGGIDNNFRGSKMKLTNTIFDENEVGQANIRMINDFEISDCIFANTKFLNINEAIQQGAVFLHDVHNSGSFNNCTFYNNEPRSGAKASDIMFWDQEFPSKVSLNNSIFYRQTTDLSIKQVHMTLKGKGNNQYIPDVNMNLFVQVATENSILSDPNIEPGTITSMCLGDNELPKGIGGLPDCDSDMITPVDDLANQKVFKVHPNPTKDWIKITGLIPGDKMTLLDTQGHTLMQIKIQNTEMTLNTSKLRAGFYFLCTNHSVFKLVKGVN